MLNILPAIPCKRVSLYYIRAECELDACTFHHGYIKTAFLSGVKESIYSCCQKLKGEPGCTQGPHVYKEKELIHLNALVGLIW